jgi:DNA-binding ferritin-like protein (Dps family)
MYQNLSETIQPVTLLLKGDSGSGKTFKAGFLPNPVFINFDQNLVGLKKLPQEQYEKVKVVNPYVKVGTQEEINHRQFWANFLDILEKVLADESIKTVVLDSLSTMSDGLSWQLLGTKSATAKPDGFNFWYYFRQHILLFCDEVLHASDLDKNIVLIAHDKVEKNELDGSVSRELSLDGSMKDRLSLHFSDVWECYTRVPMSGPVEYRVRTVPGKNFAAKCSLDLPEDFIFDKEREKLVKQFEL